MTRRKMSLAAVTALLLISATGYAEDKSTENIVFDEIVVTATRTAASSKDIPSSTQVITRQTIEEQGAQNLSDVLRYATGIQLTHSSAATGREAVSIRGFDSRFSMILIDGKRVSSEIDQNYELNRIPIENIERIEIVRGPVSSLYGTEALGGVINIITKKSQKPSTTIEVGTGLYTSGVKGKNRNSFTYDSGDVGKFSFRVSASKLENDALFKSNGLTFEPYGTRKNINASVDYRVSQQETVSFSTGFSKEATDEYVKPKAVILKAQDYVERNENALSYTISAVDSELFLRFYQSVMDKSLDQYKAGTQTLANWVRAKRTVNVYEGRFTKTLNSQHRLTFGAEYRPETFRGTAVSTGEGTFYAYNQYGNWQPGSTAHLNYSATYVQDEWNVSDKLLTVISLRYDDSNKFESNLSPKLGLTYKLADNTRLKMNVSQGFRSPTPNQLYQKDTTQQGNPNLKSEKSHSYEISLEKDWNKNSGKLTFFKNNLTNMIDLISTNSSTTNKQYQNINKASINGVEAELTQVLSDRLSWTNSYTYLDAIDEVKQQRLENRARHVFSSGLSYHNLNGFTANLQAQTFINYYLNSSVSNKSYSVFNLAMTQKLSEHHKIMLSVDNIFNRIDEDLSLPGTCIHGSIQYSF